MPWCACCDALGARIIVKSLLQYKSWYPDFGGLDFLGAEIEKMEGHPATQNVCRAANLLGYQLVRACEPALLPQN